MTREQLGSLVIASEDLMYHVAKTLLYSDADCADAIQEAEDYSDLYEALGRLSEEMEAATV